MKTMDALQHKLLPFFPYILYGLILLVGVLIVLMSFVLLRGVIKKANFDSGDAKYDHEQIASEIETEIGRLEDLRQRLNPNAVALKAEPRLHDSQTATASAAAGGAAPSEAQINALVEERVKTQLQELQTQLATTQGELKKAQEAAASAGPGATGGNAEELTAAKAEIEKEKLALQEKVGHLEKVLAEYQIFEEDFALVKKYKAENEQLRKQLEAASNGQPIAASAVAPSAEVTEADIANMFNELSQTSTPDAPAGVAATPAPDSATTIAADAPTAAPAVTEVAATPAEPSAAPTPAPAAEAAAAPAVVEAAPVATNEAAAAPATPADKAAETEALAESAATDDRLIAEFEKLLGETKS